jgi:uncharacterized cupin superfamily protein
MTDVRRVNLFSAEVDRDSDDPPGYEAGYVRLGPRIGATRMGATIYELGPGQSNCPYHYEYGCEEWLLVIEGRPTIRHPDGEDELAPGDLVCFPEGPVGAHKVTNRTGERARVMILSTKGDPAAAVYPDSDKIGIWTGNDADQLIVRRESAVDYWDREP